MSEHEALMRIARRISGQFPKSGAELLMIAWQVRKLEAALDEYVERYRNGAQVLPFPGRGDPPDSAA